MNFEAGCYLVAFRPHTNSAADPKISPSQAAPVYVGTLRVVNTRDQEPAQPSKGKPNAAPKATWRVSGDLYQASDTVRSIVRFIADDTITWEAGYSEIPVLPLTDYAYYLDVTAVRDVEQGRPVLELRAHRYDPASQQLTPGALCQLPLERGAAAEELVGRLMSGGEERGRFWLRRINSKLRRAQVRVFCIQPTGAGPIRSPRQASRKPLIDPFRKIGWELSVTEFQKSNADFGKAGNEPWAAYDLGVAAARLRDESDSALGWTYDLLCVSGFENNEYLGIMFDAEATDLNERPRECAAVAALQTLNLQGESVAAQDAFGGALYLRTACHELGHAMNLPHNLTGRTLMNITEYLLAPDASKSGFAPKFKPAWSFDAWDTEWLQHAPDIAIRPGGISRHAVRWGRGSSNQVLSVSLFDLPAVALSIRPVLASFPWGAPIRVDYSLSNLGAPVLVPKDLSLGGGYLSGRVLGPDRQTRFFRSAFRCCDSVAHGDGWLQSLTDTSALEGMTLLRGIDGPLFPVPGIYQIELELKWDHEGRTHRVSGQTSVTVAPPDLVKDPSHMMAAQIALGRSSMMPPLVQGYLDQESVTALSYLLQSTTLAPHYYATALKCRVCGDRRNQQWGDLTSQARRSLSPPRSPRILNLRSAGQLDQPLIPIVLNARERGQLDQALWRKSGVSSVRGDKLELNNPALGWLNDIKSIVVPSGPTDRASETAGTDKTSASQSSARTPSVQQRRLETPGSSSRSRPAKK